MVQSEDSVHLESFLRRKCEKIRRKRNLWTKNKLPSPIGIASYIVRNDIEKEQTTTRSKPIKNETACPPSSSSSDSAELLRGMRNKSSPIADGFVKEIKRRLEKKTLSTIYLQVLRCCIMPFFPVLFLTNSLLFVGGCRVNRTKYWRQVKERPIINSLMRDNGGERKMLVSISSRCCLWNVHHRPNSTSILGGESGQRLAAGYLTDMKSNNVPTCWSFSFSKRLLGRESGVYYHQLDSDPDQLIQ